MGLGLVALQTFFHQIVNHLLVFAAFHINEIADNQTANIPEPQLQSYFICCLSLCLEICLFGVPRPLVTTCFHVDGHERFGLIDHNITAALQPDLPMKSIINLFLDSEILENRSCPVVVLNPVACPS